MNSSENKQIRLSIVIAAWNGSSLLRECLSSLQNQINEANEEIIVASNFESGISDIKAEFPFAGYFIFSPETTVPQLRTHGITRACGAIVALVEDFCALDSNWCGEIKKAHELPYAVIGGAVENASARATLDWAVYFFDYGKYMPPNRADVTDALSGANVSYKKEILDLLRGTYQNGFYETSIHEELKQRGHELYLTPAALAYHNKTYNFKKTVFQFYHQARSFAAVRVLNAPFLKRLLFVAASLILPILLPARIVWRTIIKKRNVRELLIALPSLIVLTSVWACGEFCGYSAGEGKSGGQWK